LPAVNNTQIAETLLKEKKDYLAEWNALYPTKEKFFEAVANARNAKNKMEDLKQANERAILQSISSKQPITVVSTLFTAINKRKTAAGTSKITEDAKIAAEQDAQRRKFYRIRNYDYPD
jgi:hypothetical protein